MPGKYKILLIDNVVVRKMDLEVGENIIGNDIDTKMKKKKIFNEAAKINLSPDYEITITPYDGVLCYIKIYGTLRWKLVRPNKTVILNIKDTCLLFPNKIWFKVICAMDTINENRSPKRKLEKINENKIPNKRCCSEVTAEIDSSNSNESNLILTNCTNNINIVNDDSIHSDSVQCSNFDILETENSNDEINFTLNTDNNKDIYEKKNLIHSELDNCSNFNVQPNQQIGDFDKTNINSNTNNLNQLSTLDETNTNNNNNDLNQTSTSNIQNITKQKCKYGSECYRVNDEHKKKYSHPGDIEYDLPDNRPECMYGKKCYRKNPQHKIDYKHTISKRKKAQTFLQPASLEELSDWEESTDEESVDESEYEPSFIDDESLEEYESDFDADA